jgi:hypothetical protein
MLIRPGELSVLKRGVGNAYDGDTDEVFTLHAYIVQAIGDQKALQKVLKLKGPGAKAGCRICPIQGQVS